MMILIVVIIIGEIYLIQYINTKLLILYIIDFMIVILIVKAIYVMLNIMKIQLAQFIIYADHQTY